MGRVVLIFLLGSIVIFGVYNVYINKNLKNSLQTSVNYYGDTEARNIGNTMMQMILSQLADSNSWRVTTAQTLSLLNGHALYTVVDSSSPNTNNMVKVTVYSYCNGIDTNIIKPKTIVAYFHPPDIPQFMKYAIATGGDLSSFISINTNVQPLAGYSTQADVQIDGNFNLILASMTETGNLNYTGSQNTALAYTNITSVSQGPQVSIPNTINTTQFENAANPSDIHTGTYTLPSTVTLGTKSNPKVIVVKGNLNLDNTITYTGYGSILVEGNVSAGILNKVNLKPVDQSTSGLGLYVTGNLSSNFDQTEMDANIFVLGNVSMIGVNTIKGNLITPKSLTMVWSTNIYYVPMNPALVQQFSPMAARPSDIRYYLE